MATALSGNPLPIRNHMAPLFQTGLFVLDIVMLATMAIEAQSLAYFPGDVAVSHAVQAHSSARLDEVLGEVSWFGFHPNATVSSESLSL